MLADNGHRPPRGSFSATAAVAAACAALLLTPPPLHAAEPRAATGVTVIPKNRAYVEVVSVEPIPFRRLTVQVARDGGRWHRRERIKVGDQAMIAVRPGRWRFRTVARMTADGVRWRSNTALTRVTTRGTARVRLTIRPQGTVVRAPAGDVPPDGRLGELFSAVNATRSTPQRCGVRWKPAVPPVRYNAELGQAAAAHADDMAARDYFSHMTPEGRDFVSRIRRAGYTGQPGGENLAMGFSDAAAVVAGWLASPGHCENLMEPAWTEMGLGYAQTQRPGYTSLFTYWVQEFGYGP